jgi:hypothetical protein
MDEKKMKELKRWVNSPSVDKERTKIEVKEEGEEVVLMMVSVVVACPRGGGVC